MDVEIETEAGFVEDGLGVVEIVDVTLGVGLGVFVNVGHGVLVPLVDVGDTVGSGHG